MSDFDRAFVYVCLVAIAAGAAVVAMLAALQAIGIKP